MKKLAVIFSVIAISLSPLVFAGNVGAVDVFDEQCKNNSDNVVCQNKDDNVNTLIRNIVNTLLFIVGAISVVMLIYGGLRYSASAGNPNAVTSAKNTIMYAIVGLVVAFAAFAIVNWVMDQLVVSNTEETAESSQVQEGSPSAGIGDVLNGGGSGRESESRRP